MADSSYDYFFTGPHDDSRRLVDHVAQTHGFRLEQMPNGSTKAVRGDLTKTLVLGVFAGKAFHVVLWLQYFVDDSDRLVVRLSRDLGTGLVKGGALGAARSQEAFAELAHALGRASTGGQLDPGAHPQGAPQP